MSPTITHDPMTPMDLEHGAEAVSAAEKLGAKLPNNGRVEHGQDWSAVYDGRWTCRMGTDPCSSVVDLSLKVHGIRGLRIVDGSVLPSNTPYLAMPEVLMMAERASDLITDVETYPVSNLPRSSLMDAVLYSNSPEGEVGSFVDTVQIPVILGVCAMVTAALIARRLRKRPEMDCYVQA